MPSTNSQIHPRSRAALRLAVVIAPLVVAGCGQLALKGPGGGLPSAQVSPGEAKTAEAAAKPAAPAASTASSAAAALIGEARAMAKAGDKRKALAHLDKAAADHVADKGIARERGMLALELGQLAKAEKLLSEAIDTNAPDWRVHSALGATLSAAGKQKQAQAELKRALDLSPGNPAVLNNLALSHALDGKPQEAERLLRQVAGTTGPSAAPHAGKARQNLALLLGFNGRLDEARMASEGVIPSDKAEANLALLASLGRPEADRAEAGGAGATKSAAQGLDQPVFRLGGPVER